MCFCVDSEPLPVQCSFCDRRFRNLAALNGHMRLHGGYVKKVCLNPISVMQYYLNQPFDFKQNDVNVQTA